jgi:hypothetical protein
MWDKLIPILFLTINAFQQSATIVNWSFAKRKNIQRLFRNSAEVFSHGIYLERPPPGTQDAVVFFYLKMTSLEMAKMKV